MDNIKIYTIAIITYLIEFKLYVEIKCKSTIKQMMEYRGSKLAAHQ